MRYDLVSIDTNTPDYGALVAHEGHTFWFDTSKPQPAPFTPAQIVAELKDFEPGMWKPEKLNLFIEVPTQ